MAIGKRIARFRAEVTYSLAGARGERETYARREMIPLF